jgi:predicted amidohydrolase YtcJ
VTRILFRGGYVHTPADPHATAVAVEGGQIVWTGDDDAAEHFLDNAERVVELEGRLVTPAFVDAHAHLSQTGLASRSVDLSQAKSAQHALDLLSDATGDLVVGHGWDETGWADGPFTGDELSRAVGGRLAYVTRVDMHSAIVTGIAGFHGRVEREDHHAVRDALADAIPLSARAEAIRAALEAAASKGIGMVHEIGAPHINPLDDFRLIDELTDVHAEVVGYWGDLDTTVALEHGLAGAAGDLCADGAIGSRTAALQDTYTDDASTSGHLYLTAEQVAEHVVSCTEADLQAGFHLIGDRAVAEVVAGFQLAAEKVGAPALVQARHRLEHLEMVTREQAEVLGSLGVTASVQPMFDGLWGGPGGLYERRLGERARGMNPFASLNRAGMALAFGSDAPVTPFDPWGAIRAATWHHDETERVTVRAAFNAHTRGGWRAAKRDEGGVIALGAPASIALFDVPGDLVVQTPDERVAAWSTDTRAGVPLLPGVHPDEDLPTCVLTLVHGKVAYDELGALP